MAEKDFGQCEYLQYFLRSLSGSAWSHLPPLHQVWLFFINLGWFTLILLLTMATDSVTLTVGTVECQDASSTSISTVVLHHVPGIFVLMGVMFPLSENSVELFMFKKSSSGQTTWIAKVLLSYNATLWIKERGKTNNEPQIWHCVRQNPWQTQQKENIHIHQIDIYFRAIFFKVPLNCKVFYIFHPLFTQRFFIFICFVHLKVADNQTCRRVQFSDGHNNRRGEYDIPKYIHKFLIAFSVNGCHVSMQGRTTSFKQVKTGHTQTSRMFLLHVVVNMVHAYPLMCGCGITVGHGERCKYFTTTKWFYSLHLF